jgi:cyanate permease
MKEDSPGAEGILILLDSALALGSKLEAWVAAVVKNAALALADLMAWFPRLERRTAERVTRVMSYRLFYSKEGRGRGW